MCRMLAAAASRLKSQARCQIKLADDHRVGLVEHGRIFQRLVLAVGDGEQHDAQVLAQIIAGRADEVADVLDDEEVQPGHIQLLDSAGHHVRFEMADRAGGDLDDRRAGLAQAAGVVVGGQVADNDGGLEARAEPADGFADQRRFSRAGGGKDIDDQNPARPEEAAVALGQAVVLLQDGVPQFQRLAFLRARFGRMMMVRMLMSVLMSVIVGVIVAVLVP